MFSTASKTVKANFALCLIMSLLLEASAAPATSEVSWTLNPTISAASGRLRKVRKNSLYVCKGDSVRFTWGGFHAVAQTTSRRWKSCNLSKYKDLVKASSGGKKTIKMNKPGLRYIYCQVPGHCNAGQKIRIVTRKKSC